MLTPPPPLRARGWGKGAKKGGVQACVYAAMCFVRKPPLCLPAGLIVSRHLASHWQERPFQAWLVTLARGSCQLARTVLP